MSSSNVSQKYVVATVSKGTYFLSACSFYFSWVTGAHDGLNIITIKSPVYNSQTYPLTFTVEPGEVKYLGNIEIIRPQNPNAVFIPVFQIHNQLSEAKKFMQERYPNLSSKLVEGLIKKTAKQLLVEESQE
jgi:hypothetical protein